MTLTCHRPLDPFRRRCFLMRMPPAFRPFWIHPRRGNLSRKARSACRLNTQQPRLKQNDRSTRLAQLHTRALPMARNQLQTIHQLGRRCFQCVCICLWLSEERPLRLMLLTLEQQGARTVTRLYAHSLRLPTLLYTNPCFSLLLLPLSFLAGLVLRVFV